MIVWALFDSGNGSYTKVLKTMKDKGYNIDYYPIGLDIENKNNHFIEVDLADYSKLFGKDLLFKKLDSFPKPDVIIASPPCESWSIASTMFQGNACWKQEMINGFEKESKTLSKFTIRPYEDYNRDNVQFKYERSFFNRINGELTAYNTFKIIDRYKPKVYIIENPLSSRIWNYFENILGFKIPYDNKTYYGHYDYPIKKPTRFKANIDLDLNYTSYKHENPDGRKNLMGYTLQGYNNRSNIPEKLVKDIFLKVYNFIYGGG